jgi:pimeloyl-ACP methyl ester carboxylesterase
LASAAGQARHRDGLHRVRSLRPDGGLLEGGPGGGEWGNPVGPALVLVHGFAQCHLCFAPQVGSALARDFRIVAYDLRGHGASDKPADAKAYQGSEVWAKDLAAVLAIAGLNFVASLVIEDPRCRGPAGPKPPAPGQPLAEQIAGAIAFLDGCYGIKPSESEFRVALAYNMLVPAHVRQAIAGWSTDPAETTAALKRVRVPPLVTQGRRDTIVLRAAAEMTAATIAGARLSWFDDCGHSPFSEDAPRFNAELAAFMADPSMTRR